LYGRSNCYFRMNYLERSSLGEGGGGGGYNLGQDMVTGIQPARPGSVRDYAVYGESRLNIDGPFGGTFTVMTFLGNVDVEPFSGRVEAALIKDGAVAATLGGEDVSLDGFKNGHSGSLLLTLRDVAVKVSGVADGDYDMCLVYKGSDGDDWNILRHSHGLPSRSSVTVKDGQISLGEKHTPYPDIVQHSAISTDGDFYAGGFGRASFSIESLTGDYNLSALTMRLTGIDNPSDVFDSTVSVSVYNQSVETVDVTFPVSADAPAGRYILTGLVVANGKEYPFDLNGYPVTEVNLFDTPSSPVVRLTGTPTWQVNNTSASVPDRLAQGEYLYVTGYFRNAGAPGQAKIEARLTDTATGESLHLLMAEASFVDDKTVAVTFARQVPHNPGTYTVEFLQVSDDYSMNEIVPLDAPLYVTVDPSDIVVADVTEFEFPDRIAKSERVSYSVEAVGRKTASGTLYFRVRQLNNKNGEIVNMKSGTRFAEGQTVSMSGNYRPGSSLDDGLYMVILEAGSTGQATPLGNYPLYAKTVAIGDVNSVDMIEAAQSAVAIWLDGDMLRVVPADGQDVKSVEVYTTSGMLAAVNRYDLSGINRGIYLVSVTLANGSRTVAKIALK
ncbi:MAG: T9SS type A sorting domain-containing protein, partial [Muribaculaceae bacterium]|nr:T9SS type A sorting domain-containing protein [Muribaculaceae bacterium]